MIKTFHETKRYSNPLDNQYFWFKNESYKSEAFAITFDNMDANVECSKDNGVTWVTGGFQSVGIGAGEKVYIRCDSGFFMKENQQPNYWSSMSGYWSVGGPISALIDYTDMENVTSIPNYSFYYFLERISSNLIDYSKIDFGNITTVGDYGLYNTFSTVKTKGIPDFTNFTTIGDYGMYCAFYNSYDEHMRFGVDFTNLTTVGRYGLGSCFSQSCITSLDVQTLTTMDNNALNGVCENCWFLSEVIAPNVQVWDTDKTYSWLSGAGGEVTGTKTVYAPTGVTIPTDDPSGIPYGWVRVDY